METKGKGFGAIRGYAGMTSMQKREKVAGLKAGGMIKKKCVDGGRIEGPGGPTDDLVPIMASNDEFMLKGRATKILGPRLLNALNEIGDTPETKKADAIEDAKEGDKLKGGGMIRKMAVGGDVEEAPTSGFSEQAKANGRALLDSYTPIPIPEIQMKAGGMVRKMYKGGPVDDEKPSGIDSLVSDVKGAFKPGLVRTPPGLAVDAAINAEKKQPKPGSDLTGKIGAVKGMLNTLDPGKPDTRPSGFDPSPAPAPMTITAGQIPFKSVVGGMFKQSRLADQGIKGVDGQMRPAAGQPATSPAVQAAPIAAPAGAQLEPVATEVARNPRYASSIDAAINAEARPPRQGSDLGSKFGMIKAMGRDVASLFDLKEGTTGTNIAAETVKQAAPMQQPTPSIVGNAYSDPSRKLDVAPPTPIPMPTMDNGYRGKSYSDPRNPGSSASELNDPSSNASILAQNPAGAVRKVGNSYSGANVSGNVGFVGADGNPISGRPGGGYLAGGAPAPVVQSLANPDGSQWSAGDNAIMAANIRDGIDKYRGTSRDARNDPMNQPMTKAKRSALVQMAQVNSQDRRYADQNVIAQGQLGVSQAQLGLNRDKLAADTGMEKIRQQLWAAYANGTPEQKAQAAEQLQMLNGKNAQHDEYATNVVTDENGAQRVVATNKRTGQANGQQGATPLPPGMKKQVGTANGKPVYEDANGNRFQ